MRVLITSGTGYVGCHMVAALAGQGHQVRLLVRARDRIAPALIRWELPEPTPWSGT